MRPVPLVLILISALALAACGGRPTPDEFEVMQHKPLTMPPEFELRPPRPGEPQPQAIDAGRQAFEALFPGAKFRRPLPKSDGENSILSALPASEPDIRSNVTRREADVVKKALLLADILDAEEREFRPDNIAIERLTSAKGRGGRSR